MRHNIEIIGNQHIDKVRWWHEQIVDIMLINPHWTQNRIAEYFDKTQAWLSTIINADVFQTYYHARMSAHHTHVSKGVADRCEDVAIAGLDNIKDRLKDAENEIPLPQVVESTEMALKSMGLLNRSKTPMSSNINVLVGEGGNVTLESMLSNLDGKANPSLSENNSPSPAIINGEVKEVPEEKQTSLPFD